jgi:hypothetical protein
MTVIEVGRDFSQTPGGRFVSLGPFSGEEFRGVLKRKLEESSSDVVTVYLDGTDGYGSSFLEEAFGGLVRLGSFSPEELRRRLKIDAHEPLYQTYVIEAQQYFEDALRIASN